MKMYGNAEIFLVGASYDFDVESITSGCCVGNVFVAFEKTEEVSSYTPAKYIASSF